MNPMKYVQLAALGLVVAGAIALKVLWGMYQDVKAENLLLKTQIGVIEDNMVLLNDLLITEQETRRVAQDALNDLAREVPDVVYNEELPPSIQSVLDRFQSTLAD